MSTDVNHHMHEPPWKKLKLSLERPYKDDNGEPIPVLLDITPDGQQIFEPREDPATKLGENLRRIFVERGHDFFDKDGLSAEVEKETDEEKEPETRDASQPMTPEELLKMRVDIVPQLHIALGEMTQASELLSKLLDKPTAPSIPGLSLPSQGAAVASEPPKLRATAVTKPPPIQSVQAFNAQLVVGGKDRALRKASDLLKSASESVEQSRLRSERYWVDALKIRRGNWGLIPAPLPLGSATGKGADKTSRDFLISFSLEESPAVFRRRAIGRIPTFDASAGTLEYPLRQSTRLQVTIITDEIDGTRRTSRHQQPVADDNSSLEGSLRAAQAEVVQQEIFSILIKEASNLSTASARVSERLIALEAAQRTELRFELVDNDTDVSPADVPDPVCDLVFSSLHVLLLRLHAHVKAQRLGHAGVARAGPPPAVEPPALLQPIVDLLQYHAFCQRVHAEIRKIVDGLRAAGIPTKLWLNPVGDSGEKLVGVLSQADVPQKVGGEALIRIDDRRTLRFTYLSPSSLTAHLPQATLTVGSISQLSQLLFDEVGSSLLERIREVATELSESVHGTWFVDLLTSRTIGRWEGAALNFHVGFAEDSSLVCTATSLERGDHKPITHIESYTAKGRAGLPLFAWVRQTVERAVESTPEV